MYGPNENKDKFNQFIKFSQFSQFQFSCLIGQLSQVDHFQSGLNVPSVQTVKESVFLNPFTDPKVHTF